MQNPQHIEALARIRRENAIRTADKLARRMQRENEIRQEILDRVAARG